MLDLFSFLNLAYLGTVALADANLVTSHAVKIPELHGIVAVELETATGMFADKSKVCKYSSLMVPYERDWAEEELSVDGPQTIRPPELGKIAGYAFVLNKVKCPGKDAEGIFSTIEWHTLLRPGNPLGKERFFQTTALHPDPDSQPKWLPQVMRVIEAAAESNPTAKSFVDFSRKTAASKAPEGKQAGEVN